MRFRFPLVCSLKFKICSLFLRIVKEMLLLISPRPVAVGYMGTFTWYPLFLFDCSHEGCENIWKGRVLMASDLISMTRPLFLTLFRLKG